MDVFGISVENVQVSLKYDKNKGTVHEGYCTRRVLYMEGTVHGGYCTWRALYMEGTVHGGYCT